MSDTIRDRVTRAHNEVLLLEAAATHGGGYLFDDPERFVAMVANALGRVSSDLHHVERDLRGDVGDTPSLDHDEWMRAREPKTVSR